MIVDNYQLVALSSTAGYNVTRHGSLKTTLFGGEALVIEITGPGTVYIQTKNVMEFVRSIIPFFAQKTLDYFFSQSRCHLIPRYIMTNSISCTQR